MIIYFTLSKYFRPLDKLLKAELQLTYDDDNRQNSEITDKTDVKKDVLEMSETCSYMVHLDLGYFFLEVAKIQLFDIFLTSFEDLRQFLVIFMKFSR